MNEVRIERSIDGRWRINGEMVRETDVIKELKSIVEEEGEWI